MFRNGCYANARPCDGGTEDGERRILINCQCIGMDGGLRLHAVRCLDRHLGVVQVFSNCTAGGCYGEVRALRGMYGYRPPRRPRLHSSDDNPHITNRFD